MVFFWIIVGLLVAAALLIVLPSLLGRSAKLSGPTRDEINRVLYRQRLAELKRDVDNDVLSRTQYARARLDLERELLSESEDNTAPIESPTRPRTRWAAWIVGIGLPVLAIGLYVQFSTGLRTLSPKSSSVASATGAPQSPAIDEMVDLIEARLKANSNDRTGWIMLARANTLLRRYTEASRAYARADRLAALKDPRLLVTYAQSLAIANGNRFEGRPTQLLKRALQLDPENPYALWLAGWGASQRQDFARAVQLWEQIENSIPAGSPAANSELFRDLPERIAAAKRQATAQALTASGKLPMASDKTGGATARANAAASGEMGDSAATAVAATVHVAVRLAPNLAKRVSPSDTVFIYAQAVKGARMPLAIARAKAAKLPLEVTLDDSMTMAPIVNLSSAKQVTVSARVSKTGDAMPRSGDLLGESPPASTHSDAQVSITIDQIVP
jgi:cytochrome c-type biogenesis protein CcmH